jgi:hypothetical protein
MAGELTRTPPPLHVPGTPVHHDEHLTTPPASQSTDNTPDAPTTGTGTTPPAGGAPTSGPTSSPSAGPTHHTGIHVPGTPVSVPPLPTTNVPPVDQVLTLAQATVQCTLDGLNQLLNPAAFQTCLDNYMNPRTPADKQAAADAKARLEKLATLPTGAPKL